MVLEGFGGWASNRFLAIDSVVVYLALVKVFSL